MIAVDDFVTMLGRPLDEGLIFVLTGLRGVQLSDEIDPAHPEDQRHYYTVAKIGLELLIKNSVIDTIFFHIVDDVNTPGFPWFLRNGVNFKSTRKDILELFGTPERSGSAEEKNKFAPHGWDRFDWAGGLIHFQYNESGSGLNLITAMRRESAP